jgi:hypothetical protein
MATVVVHPVAFRLIEERLMVWLARPSGGEERSLPQRELSETESDRDALERLLTVLPFHRDIVRSKHCAVFAEPGRVPHRREIALIAWVLVRPPHQARPAEPGSAVTPEPDTGLGDWHEADSLPPMVHDHRAIIEAAYRNLGAEILHDAVTRRVLPRHLLRSAADALTMADGSSPLPPALFGLLPDPFPLSAIRRFYERLLGAEIDRGKFPQEAGRTAALGDPQGTPNLPTRRPPPGGPTFHLRRKGLGAVGGDGGCSR